MNLRHLRYFVAAAERLSFSAAAKHLGMAQPPLSIQIRNLEAEVGGALFLREKRQISLTPLGNLLLDEARSLLQQSKDFENRIRDAVAGRSGEIRISYTQGALSEKITRRIRKFLRKNRGVRLILTRRHDREASLVDFDLVIEEAGGLLPGATVLERTSLRIVVPPKHRLADRSQIDLSDLIGETLILPAFKERSPTEKIFVEAIDRQGIKMDVLQGAPHPTDRIWQVSIGAGIAICGSADRNLLDAFCLPLAEPLEIVTQGLPAPSSRSTALTPFLEAIRE